MNPNFKVHTFDGAPITQTLDAGAIATGQAFLEAELEARDPKVYEPLMSFTYPRDIVSRTGGGMVQFTSNFFADYATAGANEYGIIGGDTNNIAIIQANISKEVYPVQTFANIIRVPYMDQQYYSQCGRSYDEIMQNGLRKNYDLACNRNAYLGFTSYGQVGLLNSPLITATLAPLNAGSTSRKWVNKTPQEILLDFNNVLNAVWAASGYDVAAIPNQVLLPPSVYSYLTGQLISSAGTTSILTYLLENNFAKNMGVDLVIFPLRECIGIGTPLTTGGANTDRALFYVNDEDFVRQDLTLPLTRVMTQPSPEQIAYLSPYIAKIGVVKFLYPTTLYYLDGI